MYIKHLNMFNNRINLKSDYSSLFDNKITQGGFGTNVPTYVAVPQQVPSGYPCTFNSDCVSPAVCQFNVCTINIAGNEMDNLSNICKGKSITECAKEMQKEREKTEVPIYIPNYPSSSTISSTGGNGDSNAQSVNINTFKCNYDKDCRKNEVCITGICVDKSNFPLIARQKRLRSSSMLDDNSDLNKQNLYTINQSFMSSKMKTNEFDVKKYFEHKKTPLDGNLSPYEYMFLLEKNNQSILNGLHDDYFYFNNKL